MIQTAKLLEKISLRDLLDISAFQELLESFTSLTGLSCSILNLDGTILIGCGWHKICVDFHRKHPITAARCLESDTVLANRLTEGEKYNVYKCKNGLVDVAVPIIIENMHLGNLFTGQFFLEPPDVDSFSRQADEFGFDKEQYLKLVNDVPVLPAEKIELAMDFLSALTVVIGSAGIDKKRLNYLNRELERKIEERTETIRVERVFSDSLINSLPGIMYVFDELGRFRKWNKNFEIVTGYSTEQIKEMNPLDFFATAEEKKRIALAIEQVFHGESVTVEALFSTITGQQIPYLFTGYKFQQNGNQFLVGVGLDISDRVKIEKEKEILIEQLRETISKVKQLSGFLPICAACKKIRDDEGYWKQIEEYIKAHSEVEFSHSICPECAKRLYPGLEISKDKTNNG